MKPLILIIAPLVLSGISHGANYTINYGMRGLSVTGAGRTFLSAPRVDNAPLSIDDNSTVTISNAQSYQFTNTNDFGFQSFGGSSNRILTINGVEKANNLLISLTLAPGHITINQSPTVSVNLDFLGDRKQVSMLTLAASGNGTHSGLIAARFSMSEVLDDPMAVMSSFPSEVFSNLGLSLDGGASFDIDATGSIVSWDWDTNYDGVIFDSDLTGQTASLNQTQLESTYVDGLSYTVALRVTDNSGAQHISSSQFAYSLVPEPSSLALLGLGGFSLLLRRRRG